MGLNYRIEVDGGINNATAVDCAKAGADTFVSGTALFGQRQLRKAVGRMRDLVTKHARRADIPAPVGTVSPMSQSA
jgi:ribulose-phosphate 3-epimerase